MYLSNITFSKNKLSLVFKPKISSRLWNWVSSGKPGTIKGKYTVGAQHMHAK